MLSSPFRFAIELTDELVFSQALPPGLDPCDFFCFTPLGQGTRVDTYSVPRQSQNESIVTFRLLKC